MEPRDRRFAHELAYGVTRARARLDHLLEPHVRRGLVGLDPVVLEVLRSGAYQILEMKGVPSYAAVSASVDQVREHAGVAPTGLVNAVLRRVAETGDGPELFPSPDDPVAYLSVAGSHPRWLVERWLARSSVEAVTELVEGNNRRPSTYLTPLDRTPAEAVTALAASNCAAATVGAGTPSVLLEPGTTPSGALAALPASLVQDPAAALVVVYSDVPPGTVVADLCAAPGGKALATARNALYLIACDRSESRIRMVTENARRVGMDVGCVVSDAARPPVGEVDVVLLDAPCTGTGTLGRHPDARWRLRPESVSEMAAVQGELIRGAARVVRPGGLLVYSTCTLEPEENENVVDAFLAAHRDFVVERPSTVDASYLDERGFLRVTPHSVGDDGSFAARLRRAA